MRDDHSHQNKADNRMPQLGVLHFLLRGQRRIHCSKAEQLRHAHIIQQRQRGFEHCQLEREQQRDTRDRDRGAQNDHGPEDQLLTGVELLGGRVALAEDTAAFEDPVDVSAVRQVVNDPHDEHHHQPQHKGP